MSGWKFIGTENVLSHQLHICDNTGEQVILKINC